ncbi:uncharacterized protein ColSpa_05500 [Colletotrichum spaethianum]|uniref:Uncharacterized protein n=1 Tax=Colletotrichum spaethianum TaxID=700344 RepID=A0AA37P7R7_9PEZI|nr:uncharacterized protein ColSpa_05500 [Colletotrichum spaethianum]GKT45319.1 hypothetical protein ColSpa_05500 [Colletotrichum spaethianum]
MARPRIPALYGILQFCLRLTLVVFEVCALASLIMLSKYGFHFPLGYVTVGLLHVWLHTLPPYANFPHQSASGIIFSMTEMVTLANSTGQIPRMRTGAIVVADFVLFVLGLVAFFYFIILNGWSTGSPNREYRAWRDDPLRAEKATWAPWYMWLQLIAAILHFLYMIMHCVDACKEAGPEQQRRRRQRRMIREAERRERRAARNRATTVQEDPETMQVSTV